MLASDWQPIFDYLEHEAGFQAAAATVTGAAAAWLLNLVIAREKEAPPLPHPIATRWLAAFPLTMAPEPRY